MNRDLSNITRNLEDTKANDIIYKKKKLEEMFNSDPDILEVLGRKEKRPLNKYVDPNHPTEKELEIRNEIIEYNEKISHKQIVDYLKLNGIQTEVSNFIMYEIDDPNVSYTNDIIKNQFIIVMCLVHENDMETEYGINRADLLSYLVKDLLCWTNTFGIHAKCVADTNDIIDAKYYARVLKFKMEVPNNLVTGKRNHYDRTSF